MSDQPASPPTQIVAVAPSQSPRWIPVLTVVLGVLGLAGVMIGALLTVGAWRADVDQHLVTLDKRMDQAEGNQRTYIPVLLGLTKDVSYLAERARRQDQRDDLELAREHH